MRQATPTLRPTVRHIARAAEVSAATVSYVLNNTPGVTIPEPTRRKVQRAAEKLDYQRSMLRRAIKTRLRHIGIAVADPQIAESTFVSQIVNGVRAHASETGYAIVVQPVPKARDDEDWRPACDRMTELHRSRLIDGFIFDKQHFLTKTATELVKRNVPIVLVNGGPYGGDVVVPGVTINDLAGAHLAMGHLLELGHLRIAHIRRPMMNSLPVYQLVQGYQQALAEHGIAFDARLVVAGDALQREATSAAVNQLMQLNERPTAIFVGDDVMAVMAIGALQKLGFLVPRDVSIVGYGDWSIVHHIFEPALTTVHAPLRENGRLAASMLIDMLEKEQPLPPPVLLEPRLVVRETTAAPPN